ncbi:hypothetical protein BJD55_gp053 [Gordonia phage Yvonnetastic]|uniref:Uncharacterized protein n=1 Tax=Gordonia phage Yvonnetastic TaxID=1821566 RepID=A0A142K9D0_9CAUD|nr:hypothetical protein BJD55_gp053 [Gordonia phage Yvonnetastic]AMS02713.1 hypothetical protein SEA_YVONNETASTIC_169 [Gordonia phage Yvonnetastic]
MTLIIIAGVIGGTIAALPFIWAWAS